MFDVVIRGGKVIDGSGGAPAVADVAIEGGRIAEVGADVGGAKREIDATDYIVSPGFVVVPVDFDELRRLEPKEFGKDLSFFRRIDPEEFE